MNKIPAQKKQRGLLFTTLALLVVLALAAVACESGVDVPGVTGQQSGNGNSQPGEDGNTPLPTVDLGDDIQRLSSLQQFDNCAALLDYLKTEAAEQVGPYGLDGGVFPVPFIINEDVAVAESADSSASSGSQPASVPQSSGGDEGGNDSGGFSTTNVQVVGVDEPDIVKTDGNRILAIAQDTLHYVDVSGDEAIYRGNVALEGGWSYELFVQDNRAMIFSNGSPEFGIELASDSVSVNPFPSTASIQEVDLSDPTNMEVVSVLQVEGQYLSARSVGDVVWVSLTSYPVQFAFVYPSSPDAEEAAEVANRDIIANSELADWLPQYQLAGPSGSSGGHLPSCEQVHVPDEFAGFSVSSILTLDLSQPLTNGAATSVLADGQTLYGSGTSLYLAINEWERSSPNTDIDIRQGPDTFFTSIHKFSVSVNTPAVYEASGTVNGQLLNQFAMDEHNGYFRIATTTSDQQTQDSTVSQVTVLDQRGRQLVPVGRVGGLGEGERIFSVRFVGDRGYVVTFRQVDPLYVLDLSDPSAPSVTGELKIPGFSTYLHPIGDGLLIGVGQDADPDGRTQGTKVSLFDVSNPADPTELSVAVFPGGNSAAEYDHRAFLYWEPSDLVMIPLSQNESGLSPGPEVTELADGTTFTVSRVVEPASTFHGAVALRVNRDGITEIGRISQGLDNQPVNNGCRLVTDREVLRYFSDEENRVQVCSPNASGGYPGFSCETGEWLDEEFPTIQLADGEYVELCWITFNTIDRLLVVDENVWSLSRNFLQANDLGTLALSDKLSLSG